MRHHHQPTQSVEMPQELQEHYGKLINWQPFHRGDNGSKIMRDSSLPTTKYIYHMLRWSYAKQVLENRRLRFSPVTSWPDQYERWWCELLFNRVGPLTGQQAYAICWTKARYDEPLWRMAAFKNPDPIVRIRCNVENLLDAGRGLLGQSSGSLYLGAVEYRYQNELLRFARSVNAGDQKEVTRTAASLLLHKRKAFRFEKEVRLLWLEQQPPKECIFVDIDPKSVISQIMISPHASKEERKKIRFYLYSSEIEVKRSAILRAPTL